MKKVGSYGSGFLTRIKRSAGDVLAYRWHDAPEAGTKGKS